jgi:Uma2 family endonuclease
VLIVNEVADGSIECARTEKLPRYAQAGIIEVWIVDLEKQAIEQYTDPRNGAIIKFD